MGIAVIDEKINLTVPPQEWPVQPKKRLRALIFKQLILVLAILIFFSSVLVIHSEQAAQAANPGRGNICIWHTVQWGDTLGRIAAYNHTTIWILARVNSIWNVNLIFAGQPLCIPHSIHGGSGNGGGGGGNGGGVSGILPNGNVLWYDYNALQYSSQGNVESIIQQTSAYYGLSARLVKAIAWQESGWRQHVISGDGGIGTMQIMPYTAMSVNSMMGTHLDPYHTSSNIRLGVYLLRWLWSYFHGNLVSVISAYNEGAWAVSHQGIFNWNYVNSVLSLMRRY